MYRCLVCRWGEITLDDALAPTRRGTCICLRCYTRETGTYRRVDTAIVRAIDALEV
jgi:hypothetical protein